MFGRSGPRAAGPKFFPNHYYPHLEDLLLRRSSSLRPSGFSAANSSASAKTTIEEPYSADRHAVTRSFHSSTAQ